MKQTAVLALALAWPVAAPPALAQDEAPAEEADASIVVSGEPDRPPSGGEAYDQARELSRVGRYHIYDRALPRFEAPVCPATLGIRDDYAGEITDRIRANAAQLDIPVAKSPCEPNLLITFVDDGQELVSRLAKAHSKVFCIIEESERAEILRQGEPVRVWSHIRTIDVRRTGGPTRIFRCREDIPSAASKVGMFLPERRDIVSSLVVFERDAVLGMNLVQLADYATMRGLSHTRPADGNEAIDTILALFEGDRSSPLELTSFDVGYLESLYRGPPDQRAATRFVGVRRRTEADRLGR